MCYLEGGNSGNMEKSVYYSCESWIVAACHLPGRNTLGQLSLHYDNSFVPLFQFPERNMLLAILCWDVMRHTVSPTQSKNWHGKEYSKTSFLME